MIKKEKSKINHWVAGFLLLIFFIFASLHLFRGDVLFHTDLARDVLIVEEIVETRRPDLIGPRAGGIPGLFFGPIWYYIMIPFFIIGSGSPVAIGVFWLLMVIASVFSSWWVSSRIFGKVVGLLTAVLYSSFLIPVTFGFTQSFGSLIFSPFIFYFNYRFYKTVDKKYLIVLSILIGFMFHFQPAFAMLIGAISFVFSIFILRKEKKLQYIFFFLLGIIPLINFIVFDLRHDFLQTKAFFNFLTSPPQERIEIEYWQTFINRADGFFQRLNLISGNRFPSFALSIFINGFIFVKALKNKKLKGRVFYLIFFSFYLLFWISSFLFRGQVWDFYHWGFLPIVVMIFSSLHNILPKKVSLVLYLLVLIPSLHIGAETALTRSSTFSKTNSSSWIVNRDVAEFVYNNSDNHEFGYFVYSPDRFGFSVKYALNYLAQFYSQTPQICSKKQETFLVYYPTPERGAVTDPVYWKKERVRIDEKPVLKEVLEGGIVIEKYLLSNEKRNLGYDSTLICDLGAR